MKDNEGGGRGTKGLRRNSVKAMVIVGESGGIF